MSRPHQPLQLAAAGDEMAFARIVAAHQPEMLRVAYVVTGDWGLADDAAQAALWIAWRKLPSLRDPAPAAAVAARGHRQRGEGDPAAPAAAPVVELVIAEERQDAGGDPGDAIGQVDLANALHRLGPGGPGARRPALPGRPRLRGDRHR